MPVPIGTPRPMCPCVTTMTAGLLAHGSSPRTAFPVAQWLCWCATRRLQLRGQLRLRGNPLPHSHFDPRGEPSRGRYAEGDTGVNFMTTDLGKRPTGPGPGDSVVAEAAARPIERIGLRQAEPAGSQSIPQRQL